MIDITESAANRIKSILKTDDKYLRLSLKAGGCAGFSYEMDVIESPTPGSTIVEKYGAKVQIDPSSEMYLIGMTLDYKETMFESAFEFKNPNAHASCGCGTSVAF